MSTLVPFTRDSCSVPDHGAMSFPVGTLATSRPGSRAGHTVVPQGGVAHSCEDGHASDEAARRLCPDVDTGTGTGARRQPATGRLADRAGAADDGVVAALAVGAAAACCAGPAHKGTTARPPGWDEDYPGDARKRAQTPPIRRFERCVSVSAGVLAERRRP